MQGVTAAGRWLFAAVLAVSVLVFAGSVQAQGYRKLMMLPPVGVLSKAPPDWEDFPAQAPEWAKEGVFCRDAVSCGEWERLKSRAERGDVAAMRLLWFRLLMGDGVLPNDVAASVWMEKAARRGDCVSQLALGMYLLRERWDADTVEQGLEWVQKASDYGCATASMLLLEQEGISDEVRAHRDDVFVKSSWKTRVARVERLVSPYRRLWVDDGDDGTVRVRPDFKRAIRERNVTAVTLGAVWLMSGSMMSFGVPVNADAGIKWLGEAAEKGDVLAAALGTLCLIDYGMDEIQVCGQPWRDKVYGWLEKAAESGDGESMALFGNWLLTTNDGKDFDRGMDFIKRAAEKGVPSAFQLIAWEFQKGRVRSKSFEWYQRFLRSTDSPDMLELMALVYGVGLGPVFGENGVITDLRRLAWRGDPALVVSRAMGYDGVYGGKRFPEAARFLYEVLARQGKKEVFLSLARVCSELGDEASARHWLGRIDPDALTVDDLAEMTKLCRSYGKNMCGRQMIWLESRANAGDQVAFALLKRIYALKRLEKKDDSGDAGQDNWRWYF